MKLSECYHIDLTHNSIFCTLEIEYLSLEMMHCVGNDQNNQMKKLIWFHVNRKKLKIKWITVINIKTVLSLIAFLTVLFLTSIEGGRKNGPRINHEERRDRENGITLIWVWDTNLNFDHACDLIEQ